MPEPNNQTANFFSENLLAIELKNLNIYEKTCLFRLEYKVLLILELSKIVMYEFWYDYVNSKYGQKNKLNYMYTKTQKSVS